MNEKVRQSLNKAQEALKEAGALLVEGLPAGSVSRSYYAIFHAANALLLSKDFEFSKHSAVIASFGRDFVRPGIIEQKYHKIFIDAFEARQTAEYDIFKTVTQQFADKIFGEAQDFVAMADSYLS